MFSKLANKFHSFSDHHQILLTIAVAVLVIIGTWAVEKLLEEFLPNKATTYIATFFVTLTLLWVIKHFILHVW